MVGKLFWTIIFAAVAGIAVVTWYFQQPMSVWLAAIVVLYEAQQIAETWERW